jgi:DNA-binding PadR family transcriptional regulator
MLSEGPKYGLQLRKELEEATGHLWSLNDGQIYATLQRLQRDGAVTPDESGIQRSRRHVRITETGRSELAEWLGTPPEMIPPPRDEIIMKVLSALHLPNVSVHEVIHVHRAHLATLMREWSRLQDDDAELDLSFALGVDAVLLSLDALIHWLDEALASTLDPPAPDTDCPDVELVRKGGP